MTSGLLSSPLLLVVARAQHRDALPAYPIDPVPAESARARAVEHQRADPPARRARSAGTGRTAWRGSRPARARVRQGVEGREQRDPREPARGTSRPARRRARALRVHVRARADHRFMSGLNEFEWRLDRAEKSADRAAAAGGRAAVRAPAARSRARAPVPRRPVALAWVAPLDGGGGGGRGGNASSPPPPARAREGPGDGGGGGGPRGPPASRPRARATARSRPAAGRWLAFEHLRPMSAFAASISPTFVGRLERLDADWARLGAACGVADLGRFDHELGRHPSSDDPLGSYAAVRELLRTDARAVQTLCYLLLADFQLFRYRFPPECAGLELDAAPPDSARLRRTLAPARMNA